MNHFFLPEKLRDAYLVLRLGRIDDAEEVYLKPDISKLLRMDLSGLWKFAIGDEISWYVCSTMGAVLYYSAPLDSLGSRECHCCPGLRHLQNGWDLGWTCGHHDAGGVFGVHGE